MHSLFCSFLNLFAAVYNLKGQINLQTLPLLVSSAVVVVVVLILVLILVLVVVAVVDAHSNCVVCEEALPCLCDYMELMIRLMYLMNKIKLLY